MQASVHSGVLLCSLLLEAFLRYKHQRRQSQGYLRFYRHTRDLLSLPFQVCVELCHRWISHWSWRPKSMRHLYNALAQQLH